MHIDRSLYSTLQERLFRGKAIIILGPRQVGKTTLVRRLIEEYEGQAIYLNGDDIQVESLLRERSAASLRAVVGDNRLLVLDEAQRIPDIGIKLKLLIDTFPEIQLIVTGSSSLDLARGINEPLTGRKFEYNLFPISFDEYYRYVGAIDAMSNLERRLIYGSYPEVIRQVGEEREYLQQLVSSYLFRDIVDLADLRRTELLRKILQLLALQVGSEVNYSEIGRTVGADKHTVESYIDLLERAFVIFRLPALSRNLRNEIKRGRKIYFHDNGVRNALVAAFQPLDLRQDRGALWENYLVSERMKRNHYERIYANTYFWRTHSQQEIDYIEERDGQLSAYEFTWSPKKSKRFSKTFLKAYPNTKVQVIHRENAIDFLR